jgi:hypothetical protein
MKWLKILLPRLFKSVYAPVWFWNLTASKVKGDSFAQVFGFPHLQKFHLLGFPGS